MKKLLAISFVPGAVMALLFLIWGDYFETILNPTDFNQKYEVHQAWVFAIVLMVSDLFLPIPASAVMSAIGSKYGMLIGFIINFSGLILAGFVAYFSAILFSRKGSSFICSEKEIEEYSKFFNKYGGISVIVSRALPILPEVTSLMAGFSRMNFKQYCTSLVLGSAPVALLYSWIGSSMSKEPVWGIAIAVSIPLLLWLPFQYRLNKQKP